MKNKIWVLLSIILIIGVIALGGCATRRPTTPDTTPTPGQTRTVPAPTRVTPPTTPTPGITRTVPAPTRVTPRTAPAKPRTITPTPGTTTTPGMPGTTTAPGTVRRSTTPANTSNRAKAIAKDIAKEKDIKTASCVVTGDTALVGLQFEKQYKGKVTDAIKKSVEKRVKKHEPTIKKVVVTADPDLLSRIKTMATDIEKGKPLSGFTTEIEEIIRRINPF